MSEESRRVGEEVPPVAAVPRIPLAATVGIDQVTAAAMVSGNGLVVRSAE